MANMYTDPHGGSAMGGALSMGLWMGADLAYGQALGIVNNRMAATSMGNLGQYMEQGSRVNRYTQKPGPWAESYRGQNRYQPVRGRRGGAGHRRGFLHQQMKKNVAEYRSLGAIGKSRLKRKMVGQISERAWEGFLRGAGDGAGWGAKGLKARYGAAQKALGGIPGMAGKAPVLRALGAAPLGFLSAYMTWGTLIPAGMELGLGLFNEAAAQGAKLRGRQPEPVSRGLDHSTRQQAFTMRQASLMAMHQSQTGVRAALGNEASFLH